MSAVPAFAQSVADPHASSGDYGGMGLLQTRTARVAKDGQFEVGYADAFPYERYLITLQPIPRIEATFRYTSVENRDFQGNLFDGTGSSFKDRGADLKFVLAAEGRWLPQMAVGIQDGLGTGVFAGEYFVMSKRYHDLDFSFGLGWGYLGGAGTIKNPFVSISESFRTRDTAAGTQGGTLIPSSWFSGETIGAFGGVEYRTPLRGLSLKFEYDPNDYNPDPLEERLAATSHFNFGFNYRPFDWLDLGAGYERGNQLTFRLLLRANLNEPGIPKLDPPAPAIKPRPVKRASPSGVPLFPVNFVVKPARLDPLLAARRIYRGKEDDQLLAAMLEEGLPVESVREEDGRLVIDLASPSANPLHVARLAALFTTSNAQIISVSGAQSPPSDFLAQELRESTALDGFLDDLELATLTIQEINMDSAKVAVVTSEQPTRSQLEVVEDRYRFWAGSLERVVVAFDDGNAIQTVWDSGDRPLIMASLGPVKESETAAAPQIDRIAIARQVMRDLEEHSLGVEGVNVQEQRITVYLAGGRYRQVARNIGRAAAIASNSAPDSVEEIEIVLVSGAGPTSRVVIQRRQLEAIALGEGSTEEVWITSDVSSASPTVNPETILNNDRYPSFAYGLSPNIRQHIGSGDQFYLYQLFLSASAGVELAPGFDVQGQIGIDIYNNFDKLTIVSDSVLPRVRSDIRNYLQQGENNLIRLQANYMTTLAPDLYARVTAGYLEYMYGGFSSELLYRPFGGRAAVGIDLNVVRKREFEQRLGFLDFTTFTGHVNAYYEVPFYNLLAQVNIGQYLAGDRGATFQVSRSFDSGVRVGAFATLTNVPFNVFGEGSFDKGFFIVIPLDLFSLRSSTSGGVFGFTPLTRDGGQRLSVRPRLYDVTGGGSLSAISQHWDQLLR